VPQVVAIVPFPDKISAAEMSPASETSGRRQREQQSHETLQFATLGRFCTSRSKSSRLLKQLPMLLAADCGGMAVQGGCCCCKVDILSFASWLLWSLCDSLYPETSWKYYDATLLCCMQSLFGRPQQEH